MNAKEKAKTITARFKHLVDSEKAGERGFHYDYETKFENMKICASIVVDEIIEALKITTDHCTLNKLDASEVYDDIKYWREVSSQIALLESEHGCSPR